MSTGFLYHQDYLKHDTGTGHPERPARLHNMISYLEQAGIVDGLANLEAKPLERHWIEQVHPGDYVDRIKLACEAGPKNLDADTVVSEDSFRVAALAAGGTIAACDAVMGGVVDNAFCALRPPGHHAEPLKPMGFCLFNNVAIAAKYLQNQYDVQRVGIIDWDVHHGNGTQAAFYEDPTVFYCSIHQHPLYPGTGSADEIGTGSARGTTLNVPLPAGSGDQVYIDLFERHIVPTVRDFRPDFVLISAGFDAHRRDPLANMEVTERGFSEMTQLVKSLAEEICSGRLVSLLEGGYDLDALAYSVASHLECLAESCVLS